MAGLCAIPAGIQLVALLFLPESPRQLIVKGRLKSAKAALKRIYPYETDEQVDAKIEFLQDEAAEHTKILASQPLKQRVKNIFTMGVNRRALIIAGGLQLLQQLSGFNTLMWVIPAAGESKPASGLMRPSQVLLCNSFCVYWIQQPHCGRSDCLGHEFYRHFAGRFYHLRVCHIIAR
jgi:hypothetical protein